MDDNYKKMLFCDTVNYLAKEVKVAEKVNEVLNDFDYDNDWFNGYSLCTSGKVFNLICQILEELAGERRAGWVEWYITEVCCGFSNGAVEYDLDGNPCDTVVHNAEDLWDFLKGEL